MRREAAELGAREGRGEEKGGRHDGRHGEVGACRARMGLGHGACRLGHAGWGMQSKDGGGGERLGLERRERSYKHASSERLLFERGVLVK